MTRGKGQRRSGPVSPGPVSEQEVIDGLKPVCICKGIRQRVFVQHIRAGLSTVEELQRATGAGGGSCKGKRCTPRIEALLQERNAK